MPILPQPKTVIRRRSRLPKTDTDRAYLRSGTARVDNGGNTLKLPKAEADVHIGSDNYAPAGP